jgi:hypothetical protein
MYIHTRVCVCVCVCVCEGSIFVREDCVMTHGPNCKLNTNCEKKVKVKLDLVNN